MVEGVVLAAGRSSRAGANKALFRHRGRPLLLHALASLRPACDRRHVVLGHDREAAEALLAGKPGLNILRNSFPDKDMFSSVRLAAAAVDPAAEAFFLLPVDCPRVPPAVPAALLAAFRAAGDGRPVLPEHAGRGGHPVLLPASAADAIAAAPEGSTLRDVLRALHARRLPVAEAAVLEDFDLPSDLAALEGGRHA